MATGSFDRFVDPEHAARAAAELAELPLAAIAGIDAAAAQAIEAILGAPDIAALAASGPVARAQAIAEEAAGIDHDRGPDIAWTSFFAEAPLALYLENPRQFRLDFGPVYYRGRLDGTARVLIVGQDPAANELVGHRAFIGSSGQRIQGFLRRIGIRRDYLMVNTFLYPVFGQFTGRLAALSRAGAILDWRNALFDRIAVLNAVEAVITVGNAARDAVDRWPGAQARFRRHIPHPAALDHAAVLANWNAGLAALRAVVSPEAAAVPDTGLYGANWTEADHEPVPRRDVPFGVPTWHGVGDRATRGRLPSGATDPSRIVWTAPDPSEPGQGG